MKGSTFTLIYKLFGADKLEAELCTFYLNLSACKSCCLRKGKTTLWNKEYTQA